MSDAKISAISAILAAKSVDSVQKMSQTDKVSADFSSFMNLTSYNQSTTYQDNANSVIQPVTDANVQNTAYDKYQYKENNVIKDGTGNSYTDEQISEISEKLETFEDNVKEVLKEELGVTDEQIEDAMTQLGITAIDLTNPQNLASITALLTGSEDTMSLLTSESFQNILQDVQNLTTELLSDLGISMEDLAKVCDEVLMQNQMQDVPENDAEQMNVMQQTSDAAVTDTDEKASAVETVATTQPETATQTEDTVTVEQDTEEQPVVEVTQNADASEEQSSNTENEDETSDSGMTFKRQTSTHDTAQTETHGVVYEQTTAQQSVSTPEMTQQVPQTMSYAEIQDMINQVSEFTKLVVNGDTTSMEMQLNPENLGKIYIHVSEKAGNVTAQIAASNETVKEALAAQVADLKTSLNQQGIKVDAVEVTVASHEFERNLEQNASGEEQQAEQEEQRKSQGARRSINLNDLDSLSGVMSEEETLVAKMMQDNGNQMDVTV